MNEAKGGPVIGPGHADGTDGRGGRRRLMLKSVIVVAALSGQAASSQPQIFRCMDSSGHVVFSDVSCGSTSKKVEVVESSGGLSQIRGDGLSPQEKGDLGAIEARDAQAANQRAQGSASQPGGPSTSATPSTPAPHSSY